MTLKAKIKAVATDRADAVNICKPNQPLEVPRIAPPIGEPSRSPVAHGTISIPIRTPTTSKAGHKAASIGVVTVVTAPAKKPKIELNR